MAEMKAAVVFEPGGPEVLKLESRVIPQPRPAEVLMRVKAFGLNRSELFTRQGLSPNVRFPRVLGIEAVGFIEDAPGGEFRCGEVVATAMGGMGRQFDGAYAEFTCIPVGQVQRINTNLPWEVLGAIPETLQTAWGALFRSLRLEKGERLLIRGGTTSVGLAAATIAKSHGAFVASTTRKPEREKLLRASGVDQVFIDTGCIAEQVKIVTSGGVDKVLELVGTTTLEERQQRFGAVGEDSHGRHRAEGSRELQVGGKVRAARGPAGKDNGQNGADDVTMDAALLARAVPERPVMLQWMRDDEFGWAPFGPAMKMRASAAISNDGKIVDWNYQVWSNSHAMRPGQPGGVNLLAAWSVERPFSKSPPLRIPQPAGD